MGKDNNHNKKPFYEHLYKNPLQSYTARPKHLSDQVNGQSQQTQSEIILENQTRKRS